MHFVAKPCQGVLPKHLGENALMLQLFLTLSRDPSTTRHRPMLKKNLEALRSGRQQLNESRIEAAISPGRVQNRTTLPRFFTLSVHAVVNRSCIADFFCHGFCLGKQQQVIRAAGF